MCGIAGQLSYKRVIEPQSIRTMTQLMRHRGPDDEGIYTNGGQGPPFVGLGHRRLSIIDLSTGHQPLHNEDETVWIVYNGEAYNFLDMREELLTRGHRFATTSDTEVVVHLYEEYGENCVNYLRGMFAFAIWDTVKRKLFIARDRLGKKPLYYYWKNETLVFASELKSVLACPDVTRAVEIQGLTHFLQHGYIPDPLSIIEGVHKLPPGHTLTVADGNLKNTRYWEFDFFPVDQRDEESLVEELTEKLRESVRLRLVSDVPLGAFLSGGIDSSTIVALMAQEMDQPVKTFSIGFEEAEYNELSYARAVAELFHTDHHEMIVGPEDFGLIEKIVRHFDEPFGDASALPTYYVSQLASQHVKVVLSGDGGDELFAGYDTYAETMGRQKYDRLPGPIRAAMAHLSGQMPSGFPGKNFLYNISLPSTLRFLDYVSHISPRRHSQLLSGTLQQALRTRANLLYGWAEEAANLDPVAQMQYIDMKGYLPGDILVKVDRMSMAHSLETRVPLLDQEVVAFVNRLPSKYKLNGTERKYLLKKVAANLLPGQITNKKKQGFAVPLKHWFKDTLNDYLHQILFEQRTLQRGYFNKTYLQKLVFEYESGRRDHSTLLWHLLNLEIWHRTYVDGHGV